MSVAFNKHLLVCFLAMLGNLAMAGESCVPCDGKKTFNVTIAPDPAFPQFQDKTVIQSLSKQSDPITITTTQNLPPVFGAQYTVVAGQPETSFQMNIYRLKATLPPGMPPACNTEMTQNAPSGSTPTPFIMNADETVYLKCTHFQNQEKRGS